MAEVDHSLWDCEFEEIQGFTKKKIVLKETMKK